jgi:hypothetical protein
MEGKGEFNWPNGNKYIGNYKHSKKEGFGTYYWNDKIYYEGSWLNNFQHGEGTFYGKNKIFKGVFRYGKLIQCDEEKDIIPDNNNNNVINDNGGDNKINDDGFKKKNSKKNKKNNLPKNNKPNPMGMIMSNKLGQKKYEEMEEVEKEFKGKKIPKVGNNNFTEEEEDY